MNPLEVKDLTKRFGPSTTARIPASAAATVRRPAARRAPGGGCSRRFALITARLDAAIRGVSAGDWWVAR